MRKSDGATTSATLIGRLGDPADLAAWIGFLARYTPLLRVWCRRAGLDHHSAEDVIQTVLIEVSRKLRDFCYDPQRSFRGWLWTLCHRRIIDLTRRRRTGADAVRLFSDMPPDAIAQVADTFEPPDDDEMDTFLSSKLRDAERVQAAVRKRVGSKAWDAFALIEFRATSVRDTATALGMSYAAAYAARERVRALLRREGKRLCQAGDHGESSGESRR